MYSSKSGVRNVNNNSKYTGAVRTDNGYHYFPDDQDHVNVKKKAFSEMKIRNRSKTLASPDVNHTQSVTEWPNDAAKERHFLNEMQQYRTDPRIQKKSHQLLPFVHLPSESKSTHIAPLRSARMPLNNNESDRGIMNVFPIEVRPILLTPSNSPKDIREEKSYDHQNYPTAQHYEHYYSYYYKRQSNVTERKVRKLPDTSAMAAAKKISEDQFASKHHHHHHHVQANDTHILKEKTNNNNIVVCDDEESWRLYHISTDNKNGHADFVEIKNYDMPSAAYSEAALKKGAAHSRADGGEATEPKIHRQEKFKADVHRHQRDKEETTTNIVPQRHAKLPQTPPASRSKIAAEAAGKKSPSPRPRVLLYNQSPRLGRSVYSFGGVRLQDWRRGHHSRSPSVNASEKIKKRYMSGLVNSSRAMNTDCYVAGEIRSSSPVVVGRSFILGRKPNADDQDDAYSVDDEIDDDLENVSDFGSDNSGSSSDEDGYRLYAYKQSHALDKSYNAFGSVSPSLSSETSETGLKNPKSLLAPSLFPNVPPYLSFSSHTSKGPSVPPELYRILKWRISNVMPKVVRHILSNSGMRLLKKTNDWMGVWGKHLKSPCFRTIRPYQKINHLPGSFKIGRKDSLWRSLLKHSIKHGKKDFGFMPKTYIIPNDLVSLRKAWPRYSSRNVKWIIKPPASARGAGIRVVSKWAQIPKRRPLIVQKYIERPLLINGSKFDLRLYVLVTSMNPLRVYLYHNGLARFASVKYSDRTDTLHDRCMHLTNYSINKLSSNYAKNEDVNACHGHKWTIKSLWNYLASRGIRTDYLWDALRALVLRTLLVGESSINNMIRNNVESKYSVYELFGFDILLDADLIPWLLEVNISPSLHSELPLDAHVKAPLVQAVLNTALYNVPPKLSIERQRDIADKMSYHVNGPLCYDKRMYINYLSGHEKVKHNTFTRKTLEDRTEYLNAILEQLTPDDVRCLVVAEDELARCTPLERIFPTKDSYRYLKYYDNPRYYNRLLDAWETRYSGNRQAGIGLLTAFCMNRYHLQVPQAPVKKYSYFEGVYTEFYSPPEQEIILQKTGLCQQITEMDIKIVIVIAAIVLLTIASTVICGMISFIIVK